MVWVSIFTISVILYDSCAQSFPLFISLGINTNYNE